MSSISDEIRIDPWILTPWIALIAIVGVAATVDIIAYNADITTRGAIAVHDYYNNHDGSRRFAYVYRDIRGFPLRCLENHAPPSVSYPVETDGAKIIVSCPLFHISGGDTDYASGYNPNKPPGDP